MEARAVREVRSAVSDAARAHRRCLVAQQALRVAQHNYMHPHQCTTRRLGGPQPARPARTQGWLPVGSVTWALTG